MLHRTLAAALLVSLRLAVSSPAIAEEQKDPIDKALSACLNSPSGNSTVGQIDCAAKAASTWERELNKVYGKLIHRLDPASQVLLRTSQRQWLTFRAAERKFQSGPWSRDKGTLIGVSMELNNVEIVRSRVMTLRSYLGENPQ
jgi:uncharacterized protein YecT (DUF1311 family)